MSEAAHILVVDDDPDVRDTVSGYLPSLRLFGYARPTRRSSARSYGGRAIDLTILDINTPGIDGFTLAREIRGVGDAGIILLTATCDDLDKIVALEVGADYYVTKPYNPRELLALFNAVLRRAKSAAATPRPRR